MLPARAMKALVAGSDDARGLLAAVRSLAAYGWRVGVVTPSRRSLAASSRWAAAWHPLDPGDVAGSVRAAASGGAYDVVLPGGDAELWALSEGRDALGCAVPYGSRESVRTALDKVLLGAAGAAAGLLVPETREASDEALASVTSTVVLKSRSHAAVRAGTVVSADGATLRRAAAAMRAAGAEPVVQEHVAGPLLALAVVVRGGEVLGAVQQRTTVMWPRAAGISARAHTVPVDAGLLAAVTALLTAIGWEGLAQLQFVDGPRGPVLLDLNGRCYGSLALASAAGVDLAATWAAAFTGRVVPRGPALPGVRYQWLYGDLRASGLAALRAAPGAAHSVLDVRDPLPAWRYLRSLAR